MKKTILLTLTLLISFVGYSQVTEVFTFTNDNKPDDDKNFYENYIYQGKYYYTGKTSAGLTYLYSFNGAGQPVQIKEVTSTSKKAGIATTPTSGFHFISNEKYLYFTTITVLSGSEVEYELWRTDGTDSGTLKLLNYKGTSIVFPSIINTIKWTNTKVENSLNGDILFFASVSPNTRSLWKSNGTPEGTVLVKEFSANGISDYANYVLEKVGSNYLFIRYSSATYTYELWKTDGTASGTEQLRDDKGNPQSILQTIGLLNGRYYFLANFSDIYSTDGNVATKEFSLPASTFLDSQSLFNGNNEAYYTVKSLTAPKKVTVYYVKDNMQSPEKLTEFSADTDNYKLIYASNKGILINKYDSNDKLQAQIMVDKSTKAVNVYSTMMKVKRDNIQLGMIEYDNNLYFGTALNTDTNSIGNELWKIGATDVELVQDIYPGSITFFGMTIANGSSPERFFILNNKIFFKAGTSAGTKLYTLGTGSLGVSELGQESKEFMIYPNPSNGSFQINFNDELSESLVSVYTTSGVLVKQFNLNETTANQTLESGFYLITVTNKNKVQTQKLIIK